MDSILSEIVDDRKLEDYVRASLGSVNRLRPIVRRSSKLTNACSGSESDSRISSILEDDLLKRLSCPVETTECHEYLRWLCSILDRLTPAKWNAEMHILWRVFCDGDFTCGPALMTLALRSEILSIEALLARLNQLSPSVLIVSMRSVCQEGVFRQVVSTLTDDITLINLLADSLHAQPSMVESVLCDNSDTARRAESAVQVLYRSNDASLRRASLALLELILRRRSAGHGELIVNLLSAAEEKQVHLIEPVLTQFLDAVRCELLSEVSWILRVFERLFYHQTPWLRSTSIREFLGLRAMHRRVFLHEASAFYTDSFLDAIDRLSLYSRTETCPLGSASPIGSNVGTWLRALEEDIPKPLFHDFVGRLVAAVCSRVTWSSVGLLYLSEAIVSLNGSPVLTDLQPIQTALSLWSFQEPLIRRHLIRLWLQIACKFSDGKVQAEKLPQLASQFVEDLDCIRDQVVALEVRTATSVGLCAAVWAQDQSIVIIVKKNADFPELWDGLAKVRRIPSVWRGIEDVVRHRDVQRSGIALLQNAATCDSAKSAIVEVLYESGVTREALEIPLEEGLDWRLFYLWSQHAEPSNDTDLPSKFISDVLEISDWAGTFARPSVVCMLRALINISRWRCVRKLAGEVLELLCSLLPLTPRPMTPELLEAIGAYLDAASSRQLVSRIPKMSWMCCLETRKATSLFAQCVKPFLTILFSRAVILVACDDLLDLFEMVKEYVESVSWFGEQFYLTMIDFLTANPESISRLYAQLAFGLCYGPTFRRDQKVVLDTERYLLTKQIGDSSDFDALTECESSLNARAKCISFVRGIGPEHAGKLIEAIQAHEQAVSSTRKRYFNNSNIHRVKTRAWQVILVLLDERHINSALLVGLLDDIIEQLKNDSHQMTVRILMEWCAVKVISDLQLDVVNIIASAIDKASVERIGSICSYLNIVLHTCCNAASRPGSLSCELVSRCVPLVMPWMMAQHFAVRLHAQFIFRRIVALCRCQPSCHVAFEAQLAALARVVSYGCGAKNAAKLDGDFYMADCVLADCERYDLVFDKIPKAYGLTDVDCIPRKLFLDDAKGWSADSGRDIVRTALRIEVVDENCSRPDAVTTTQEGNFQRKIVPVSALLDEDRRWTGVDATTNDLTSSSRSNSDDEQLIVVASLIDRLPNLGGICRTAEIFAVSELALANIKVLEMKEFHTLSVSAHHWLPVRGVPVSAVEEYLREKKSDGFTLIGVEQTARSVALHEFKFPKKSLLLLGNEKEGIPLHLIHEVDQCVEIPQQGIVRSLNVHVSAALLMWEYRKQHMPCHTATV